MRVSWITDDPNPATVEYGTSPRAYRFSANGSAYSYSYVTYDSGEIHDVVIGPLKPNTQYYYRCGSDSSPEFNLKTPPSQFPVKFAVAGRWKVAASHPQFELITNLIYLSISVSISCIFLLTHCCR